MWNLLLPLTSRFVADSQTLRTAGVNPDCCCLPLQWVWLTVCIVRFWLDIPCRKKTWSPLVTVLRLLLGGMKSDKWCMTVSWRCITWSEKMIHGNLRWVTMWFRFLVAAVRGSDFAFLRKLRWSCDVYPVICPSFRVVAPTALRFLFIWQGNFAAFAGHSVAAQGSMYERVFESLLDGHLKLNEGCLMIDLASASVNGW